jgi:serine/threonine-protein kinase HipA
LTPAREDSHQGRWRLSPAFDVNPNPDKDHHVLAIDMRDPSPDSSLLLATADYYRLSRQRVEAVSEQVRAAVRGWEHRARALGATTGEIAVMQGVIDPDR